MICFTDWLIAQQGRQDAVGDFALNYAVDAEAAPRANTVADVHQRMVDVGATPEYQAALVVAAEEYSRQTAL